MKCFALVKICINIDEFSFGKVEGTWVHEEIAGYSAMH